MFLLTLLYLLLANFVSAEVVCKPHAWPGRVPSTASCDVALANFETFMSPYLALDSITVGADKASTIRTPKIFTDDRRSVPAGTSQCTIHFQWDPGHGIKPAYKRFPPAVMESVAESVRDQCIAASPAQQGRASIEPSILVYLLSDYIQYDHESGKWSTVSANRTEPNLSGSLGNPMNSSEHVVEAA